MPEGDCDFRGTGEIRRGIDQTSCAARLGASTLPEPGGATSRKWSWPGRTGMPVPIGSEDFPNGHTHCDQAWPKPQMLPPPHRPAQVIASDGIRHRWTESGHWYLEQLTWCRWTPWP